MTATWQERYAIGLAHEEEVARRLHARGWHVTRFNPLDQDPNDRTLRDALNAREAPSYLRYMPDFIVCRRTLGEWEMFWVDAKTSSERNKTSPWVTVSTVALDAQWSRWEDVGECEVIYVFSDFCTATAFDIRRLGQPGRVMPGRGSGDPYTMYPREKCVSFDERFGKELIIP